MRILKKDPQRYLVYKWETDLTNWAGSRATKREMRKVIARCCKAYRVPAPSVAIVTKDKRDGKKLDSFYSPDDHNITLRPRHYNLWDAIHEAAHAITDHICGPDLQAHSPEWFSVYLNLLIRQRVMPQAVLFFWARFYGLSWVSIRNTRPENIRQYSPRKPK